MYEEGRGEGLWVQLMASVWVLYYSQNSTAIAEGLGKSVQVKGAIVIREFQTHVCLMCRQDCEVRNGQAH